MAASFLGWMMGSSADGARGTAEGAASGVGADGAEAPALTFVERLVEHVVAPDPVQAESIEQSSNDPPAAAAGGGGDGNGSNGIPVKLREQDRQLLFDAAVASSLSYQDDPMSSYDEWNSHTTLVCVRRARGPQTDREGRPLLQDWGVGVTETGDDGKHNVFLAFRGTHSFENVITDAMAVPVQGAQAALGYVHKGFQQQALIMQPLLDRMHVLLADPNVRTVVLTGHSLGGAASTVAFASLVGQRRFEWERYVRERKLRCITFAAPLVGDTAFAHGLHSLIGAACPVRTREGLPSKLKDSFDNAITHVIHSEDIVPKIITIMTQRLILDTPKSRTEGKSEPMRDRMQQLNNAINTVGAAARGSAEEEDTRGLVDGMQASRSMVGHVLDLIRGVFRDKLYVALGKYLVIEDDIGGLNLTWASKSAVGSILGGVEVPEELVGKIRQVRRMAQYHSMDHAYVARLRPCLWPALDDDGTVVVYTRRRRPAKVASVFDVVLDPETCIPASLSIVGKSATMNLAGRNLVWITEASVEPSQQRGQWVKLTDYRTKTRKIEAEPGAAGGSGGGAGASADAAESGAAGGSGGGVGASADAADAGSGHTDDVLECARLSFVCGDSLTADVDTRKPVSINMMSFFGTRQLAPTGYTMDKVSVEERSDADMAKMLRRDLRFCYLPAERVVKLTIDRAVLFTAASVSDEVRKEFKERRDAVPVREILEKNITDRDVRAWVSTAIELINGAMLTVSRGKVLQLSDEVRKAYFPAHSTTTAGASAADTIAVDRASALWEAVRLPAAAREDPDYRLHHNEQARMEALGIVSAFQVAISKARKEAEYQALHDKISAAGADPTKATLKSCFKDFKKVAEERAAKPGGARCFGQSGWPTGLVGGVLLDAVRYGAAAGRFGPATVACTCALDVMLDTRPVSNVQYKPGYRIAAGENAVWLVTIAQLALTGVVEVAVRFPFWAIGGYKDPILGLWSGALQKAASPEEAASLIAAGALGLEADRQWMGYAAYGAAATHEYLCGGLVTKLGHDDKQMWEKRFLQMVGEALHSDPATGTIEECWMKTDKNDALDLEQAVSARLQLKCGTRELHHDVVKELVLKGPRMPNEADRKGIFDDVFNFKRLADEGDSAFLPDPKDYWGRLLACTMSVARMRSLLMETYVIAVAGPRGNGKSTLIKQVFGIEVPAGERDVDSTTEISSHYLPFEAPSSPSVGAAASGGEAGGGASPSLQSPIRHVIVLDLPGSNDPFAEQSLGTREAVQLADLVVLVTAVQSDNYKEAVQTLSTIVQSTCGIEPTAARKDHRSWARGAIPETRTVDGYAAADAEMAGGGGGGGGESLPPERGIAAASGAGSDAPSGASRERAAVDIVDAARARVPPQPLLSYRLSVQDRPIVTKVAVVMTQGDTAVAAAAYLDQTAPSAGRSAAQKIADNAMQKFRKCALEGQTRERQVHPIHPADVEGIAFAFAALHPVKLAKTDTYHKNAAVRSAVKSAVVRGELLDHIACREFLSSLVPAPVGLALRACTGRMDASFSSTKESWSKEIAETGAAAGSGVLAETGAATGGGAAAANHWK